jgi:hypothetical protein
MKRGRLEIAALFFGLSVRDIIVVGAPSWCDHRLSCNGGRIKRTTSAAAGSRSPAVGGGGGVDQDRRNTLRVHPSTLRQASGFAEATPDKQDERVGLHRLRMRREEAGLVYAR